MCVCVWVYLISIVVVVALVCRVFFPLVVAGAISLTFVNFPIQYAAETLCVATVFLLHSLSFVYVYPNSINGTRSLGKCLYIFIYIWFTRAFISRTNGLYGIHWMVCAWENANMHFIQQSRISVWRLAENWNTLLFSSVDVSSAYVLLCHPTYSLSLALFLSFCYM